MFWPREFRICDYIVELPNLAVPVKGFRDVQGSGLAVASWEFIRSKVSSRTLVCGEGSGLKDAEYERIMGSKLGV